ncbi:MAG TPA: TonB-dependent receptor [Rhizomicrobium sp.]
MTRSISSILLAGIVSCAAMAAFAETFNVPGGDLSAALGSYAKQAGVQLMVSDEAVKGVRTRGAKGDLSADDALVRILSGTGFVMHRHSSGAIAIVRDDRADTELPSLNVAAAPASSASNAALETVTVTSSKIGGDVQNIPISITALSQEQLTATQTAGGPDLIKQVPNMTFTKTNFSGYSIQLRGIGTQAISVTTDPAVAVAFNDIPFIRNHFFEQEFYDVSQVEVLRGPQGTLYGRNATAGVVNLISAKPSDQFEAMASLEIGNYGDRRPEGMINIPIVDDKLDIRVAGEWTKRQGYSFNTLTDSRIDGRDLWSGRVSIAFKPFEKLQTNLVYEHFSENDDRLRTSKQLCDTDTPPLTIDGAPVAPGSLGLVSGGFTLGADYLSQGCKAASLYSPDSFQVPFGFSLPYAVGGAVAGVLNDSVNPYASATQSRNLRVIESSLNPTYKAKNDIVEFNADYAVTPSLTFTSQTGFNHDFLWSTEDYNRFNTSPGLFLPNITVAQYTPYPQQITDSNGVFCDPQLGCSTRLVAEDLSDEHAWQLSQEFRLASNFSGPFNFSVGGNYLHYETEENYFVFINTITALSYDTTNSVGPGPEGHNTCLIYAGLDYDATGYQHPDPRQGAGQPTHSCVYIDFNPITSLDNQGHNYFLSQNPYTLNSYAAFGEAYYNVLPDVKLTTGLRFTEDRKHFIDLPSELDAQGYGYTAIDVVDQQWDQFTGRAAANWTPKLDFTDQTLVYASYAHGYKAGGANPPGATLYSYGAGAGVTGVPDHPLTFKPEYVDAFEFGSKNTLLDGELTLNGDVFYYNYEDYQISEIVDRTSINLNFNAHVKGAELEATYEPLPGLRFNFAGGWEDATLAQGDEAVDLIDRTAGNSDWVVVKPFVTQSSNCVFPKSVVAALIFEYPDPGEGNTAVSACGYAYQSHLDPFTLQPYSSDTNILMSNGAYYTGFNPASAPNNGVGFDKNLGGNKLPNAPPFTVSAGAQYTLPLSTDWAGTARGDFYWQDNSWARVFNDNPYDRLHGYKNLNLTLIFTNQNGWQVMLYDKNVFNTTAITGTFLNSDDSGLTTNIFLTDPKLIGVRVTKNW